MKKFIKLFKKVNGINVLKQYARAHVLLYAMFLSLIIGFSKKSLEIVRLAVNNKILNKLRKKYNKFINNYLENTDTSNLEKKQSNKIWFCWLQGIDDAPELVKKCYNSIKYNLTDKEIVLITEKNYKKYVKFPEYIQDKIDKNIISKTHFSDLLRLELLINYGGTWIDSTVYCSGNNYPKYVFESDLFVYQCMKPGLDGHSTRISSWFMNACTNNSILLLTRSLLYEYWKNHNNMVDYFILHDFFELAIEAYPEEWKKVVPNSNSIPHILLLRLFDEYNENIWKETKKATCFHKLSYKVKSEDLEKENTYYSVILKNTNV